MDILSPAFHLEESYYTAGHTEGLIDGAAAGLQEGHDLGFTTAFAKFSALGRLHGQSIVWNTRLKIHTQVLEPPPSSLGQSSSLDQDGAPDIPAASEQGGDIGHGDGGNGTIAKTEQQEDSRRRYLPHFLETPTPTPTPTPTSTSTSTSTPTSTPTSTSTSTSTLNNTTTTTTTSHLLPTPPPYLTPHTSMSLPPFNQSSSSQSNLSTTRLRKHITHLFALSEPDSLSLENSEGAVSEFEDRFRRAVGREGMVRRMIGEEVRGRDRSGFGGGGGEGEGEVEDMGVERRRAGVDVGGGLEVEIR